MTEGQKAKIVKMRREGCGYRTIGAALNISYNTIKSYCQRNSLGASFNPTDEKANPKCREQSDKTEFKSGTTVFVISTGHSESATESLDDKLKTLILKAASREAKSLYFIQE